MYCTSACGPKKNTSSNPNTFILTTHRSYRPQGQIDMSMLTTVRTHLLPRVRDIPNLHYQKDRSGAACSRQLEPSAPQGHIRYPLFEIARTICLTVSEIVILSETIYSGEEFHSVEAIFGRQTERNERRVQPAWPNIATGLQGMQTGSKQGPRPRVVSDLHVQVLCTLGV